MAGGSCCSSCPVVWPPGPCAGAPFGGGPPRRARRRGTRVCLTGGVLFVGVLVIRALPFGVLWGPLIVGNAQLK